jgi:cellulose synthase/poly-beta-1,6-N-acetylglucosamine synthase-like glycosyltransferase
MHDGDTGAKSYVAIAYNIYHIIQLTLHIGTREEKSEDRHIYRTTAVTMVKYSVILPTYNERENLPLIISMINRAFDEAKLEYEVIVVEDNSPDKTLEVAQQLQVSDRR